MIYSIIFDWKRTLYDPDSKALIEGAEVLLAFCQNKNIPMILMGKVKKEEDMEVEVERLGVRKYFRRIIFAEGIKDPNVFIPYIFKDDPKKTVFIGDRVRSELEIGNKLGATTIWVKQGKFAAEEPENEDQKPDYTVLSLHECTRQLQAADFGKFNQELDSKIEELLQDWRDEVKKASRALLPLAEKFAESCKGGKRIRGNLVVLGYEIAGGVILNPSTSLRVNSVKDLKIQSRDSSLITRNDNDGKEIIKVAAAYEIMHSSILAHDDIIDQSPYRRGKPSLYKAVGTEQAITLADCAFFLAIKIISESKFEEKLKNQALRMFSKTMVDTTIGQMLDIQKGDPVTVAKLKTARYSICGPLQVGAILAGADNKLIRILGEFGENLGIAYQIRDDILDGEALDYGGQEALKYVMRAKKYIPKITSDQGKRKLLEDMADYLVERNK